MISHISRSLMDTTGLSSAFYCVAVVVVAAVLVYGSANVAVVTVVFLTLHVKRLSGNNCREPVLFPFNNTEAVLWKIRRRGKVHLACDDAQKIECMSGDAKDEYRSDTFGVVRRKVRCVS